MLVAGFKAKRQMSTSCEGDRLPCVPCQCGASLHRHRLAADWFRRGECGEDIGAKKKSFHFNNGDMASLEPSWSARILLMNRQQPLIRITAKPLLLALIVAPFRIHNSLLNLITGDV
ncbi:hypothetical protein T4B_7384 [Trichinella pseudospiralis]|uniref:Uncharacterized protein n=1 Tax=Trichinella pseudospiralis TaxID=6337 RepID=A0A0V1JF35_TRIPS|nr:hypothetical protein T4B_7384 [Trichinella pseudospiralis]